MTAVVCFALLSSSLIHPRDSLTRSSPNKQTNKRTKTCTLERRPIFAGRDPFPNQFFLIDCFLDRWKVVKVAHRRPSTAETASLPCPARTKWNDLACTALATHRRPGGPWLRLFPACSSPKPLRYQSFWRLSQVNVVRCCVLLWKENVNYSTTPYVQYSLSCAMCMLQYKSHWMDMQWQNSNHLNHIVKGVEMWRYEAWREQTVTPTRNILDRMNDF